ncbi:biotin--protein ligase [Brevibacillus humidisoli]|uniref:lipoate--protein ligase family protein n=1 Tax=Brevibacillus humidisoli TaxID=2895522 RepID=UPI001E64432A|nr:biotin--protein ligase [Brevibacillus humidisoli]UFJ39634.1 biotin--protein ligase [Brevibacillus humidisoli]
MSLVGLPAHFTIMDVSSMAMTGDAFYPFAVDEVYGKQVGQEQLGPIVHIWRHRNAFVLGTRDRKLPYLSEAIGWLERQGYQVTVRNSGGAAVPLDPGVVNLSLILPNPRGHLDVQHHFELMAALIGHSLEHHSDRIETGEVGGAYCPGEFDVSIKGKKFCGIAQRRQTRAVVVQAFVLVEGSGEERGRLVQQFYEIASGGSTTVDYPKVEPESMASLSELTGALSAETYVKWVRALLCSGGEAQAYQHYRLFSPEEVEKTIAGYRQRYQLNR